MLPTPHLTLLGFMRQFLHSLAAIFKPPFEGLALVVVVYIAWAHMVYPHNDVIRGNLPDPDDYMYLVQVIDWIKGQNWYDNIQHRMNPPDGVLIPFSRLVQIPLAGGILFFKALGLPLQGAATLTALIEPLVLLGLCLSVLRRVATRLVGPNWAGASAYVALFSIPLLFEFMPGHVDHHGLVILMTMACVNIVLILIEKPEDLKSAASAGLLLALTMMVALECLPWVLLLSAWLGVRSLRQGGAAARSGAVFAVTYLLASVACLAISRPPHSFMENDILSYSIVYVKFAACITGPFLGAALFANAPLPLRATISMALVGLCGGYFLHRFPELATGPYGDIDPQLIPILLGSVEEAKPILQTQDGLAHFVNYMGMGCIALPTALIFAYRAHTTEREKWAFICLLLTAALWLTIFYQYRFLGMEAALAIIPLTALLQRGYLWVGQELKGRGKVYAEMGLLLLVGPLPALLIPAVIDGRAMNTGLILFPVDSARTLCDTAKLEGVLRDPSGIGKKPQIILSTMELGPEILFRSPHSVLAGPYHMNVDGNLDAVRFLSTPFPSEAENIARRRHVDFVLACRAVTNLYLTPKGSDPSLTETLFKGPLPSWLEPTAMPGVDNFVLFRVHQEGLAPDAKQPQGKKYQRN